MARFDPNSYETVDSRIKKFYEDHPTGRINTKLVQVDGDIGKTRWVVKASVWRDSGYDAPDGVDYAFEVDGGSGANQTSALENCATSAIGRALADIGYSGAKRTSREEMAKTQAAPPVDRVAVAEWVETLEGAATIAQLQVAWDAAGKAGVTGDRAVVAAKDARKKALQ